MIVGIERAAALIEQGVAVAYPTETVYGLAADATSPEAVVALERLKGREPGRGLSVLLAGADELARWVDPVPERARALAARFWPGPLTLVLPGFDPRLAAVATPQGVGFRCSPHPTALALARACRRPLLSTSCNPSGKPPATTAAQVEAYFGPDLPIAGGEPAGGLAPSTVVAMGPGHTVSVIREGAIDLSLLDPGSGRYG